MNHSELLEFFAEFRTIYQIVDFAELIQLKDTRVVPSEQKIYLGQVKNKQKHGLGNDQPT